MHSSARASPTFLLFTAAAVAAVTAPASAGTEWQLIDPGVPLAGPASRLVHVAASGTTYLRIEDQYMVPQFWTLEGGTWSRRLEDTYPEPLYKACVAYDPDRGVVVRFGGSDKDLVIRAETWEFDGTSWSRRTDVGAPPGRIRAGIAYDTDRHVMVLFGGYDNNDQALNDTWEYDGVQWRERTLSSSPPARYDPAMAYDQNRRRMVLAFGRSNTGGPLNDTWELNGNKWQEPHQQSVPTPRTTPAAAYDPIRQAVYVFGGEVTSGETIRWTGSSWDVVDVPAHPPARYDASMAFDASRGTLVLFGGGTGADYLGDTWEFDGTSWTELADGTHPADRSHAGAAFDPAAQRGVLFGGLTCCVGIASDRTAEWDGQSWSNVSPPASPGFVYGHAMTAGPKDGVLMFGGSAQGQGGTDDRMWHYDASSTSWSELAPPVRPPARVYASAVYSPSHDGVVLFGGELESGAPTNDTWLYRNGTWQEIASPVRPAIRSEVGLAADTLRGNVVLYGGRLGNGLSDTWILTGDSWTESPASGPGIRIGPTMAFDPDRGVTVLAGGATLADDSERTWEFDGTTWTSTPTRYSPDMRRHGGSAFWDPVRGVFGITGGRLGGFSAYYSDTWAYGTDDDGDLRVGGYDNCPETPNADQANVDLDARGDSCDCAPSDPGSWASPLPVQAMVLSGHATTTISWQDQSGAVGPGVEYDAVSGGLEALRSSATFADATCLGSFLALPSVNDARVPAPADGFYYLARSRNACGTGSYGPGRAALDAAAPCP